MYATRGLIVCQKKKFPLTNNYTHLVAIRNEIERRTLVLAGEKGIVPHPIVLTLVFPKAPNLRIIDLPGIAQHPKAGQPSNIRELTTELVKYYVQKPRTIVLSIIASHYEFQGQGSWVVVRDGIVNKGKTVVGVLTFPNCIIPGQEKMWVQVLTSNDPNIEPHLENGFVAVVTRDKDDVDAFEKGDSEKDAAYGAQKESAFFRQSEFFKDIDQKYLGRESLSNRLCQVQKMFIREQIPHIIISLLQRIKELKEIVNKYGIVPTSPQEYEELCRRLLSTLISSIFNKFERGGDGSQVKKKFQDFNTELTKINDPFTQQDVDDKKSQMGWNVSTGDLDNETFREMISDRITTKLENLCLNLVETVHSIMQETIQKKIEKHMGGYQNLVHVALSECIEPLFNSSIKRTRVYIGNIIEAEKTYIFDPQQNSLTSMGDKVKQLNSYFLFVKNTLSSSIPKGIMFFYCYPLLNGIRDKLPLILRNDDGELSNDQFFRNMVSLRGEDQAIRERANMQLKVLENAWGKLRRWQAKNHL